MTILAQIAKSGTARFVQDRGKIEIVSATHTSIPVSPRIGRFSYAIRNIVAEAQRVEATGKKVRYLNVGDPVAFGFKTPPHLIDAVERALRDGHNGYGPSAGLLAAREAVADENTAKGWPVRPDRVFITAGTSEGIDLALFALLDRGDEALVPMPSYPLYTAVIAKTGAQPVYYPTDPARGWLPDLDRLAALVTPSTRVLVVIDPNNPTGATYPTRVRRGLLEFADRHGLVILADEVYGELGYEGPVPPLGSFDPDAPVISLSSLSKAYLAPGWRTGWLSVGRTPRLDDVAAAIRKLADGRLCSTVPMQYAVPAAINGDRSHQRSFRAALKERAVLTAERLRAIPGVTCVTPTAGFYAMPRIDLPPGRTDEEYVLGLLRETGVLCVYGSGFGTPPAEGYLRIVFLASLDDLKDIYQLMANFTSKFRS